MPAAGTVKQDTASGSVRVVGHFVFGVLFQEGTPRPYEESPSADLLAQGFPATPPNEARVNPDQFNFSEEDSGNYAK
jgi:hypothetical protein